MGKTHPHQQAAWILFGFIVGAYLVMAVKFPHAYIIATYEDLVGEWAQVFLFAGTMLLAIRVACRRVRLRLFFGLLAIACAYVVGEEISWGQRLFAIESPDFFAEHNLQQETNLHNFFTGPLSTLTKQLLEYTIASGLIGYGLLYPWLLKRRRAIACWLEGKGVAASPLYLWPFFLLSAVLEIGLFHFNEAEIAEILIPLALLLMCLYYLSAAGPEQSMAEFDLPAKASRRLGAMSVLVVAVVIGLAFATTLACYTSPRLGPEMADRYVSGVEKFAGRYQRFGQWQTAAMLYREVQQDQPRRASLSRKLYQCYSEMGRHAEAREQLDRAIEVDRQRLHKRADNVAAYISLARNYQLGDQLRSAQQALQQAVTISLAKKAALPLSADVAYWLGRSYQLKGDYRAALKEFQRAQDLRPATLKYRKAALAVSRFLRAEPDHSSAKAAVATRPGA